MIYDGETGVNDRLSDQDCKTVDWRQDFSNDAPKGGRLAPKVYSAAQMIGAIRNA